MKEDARPDLDRIVADPRIRDRRTIGGRSVSALNGVTLAVVFGDCIRVQIPASSSFASIWLRAEAENTQDILLLVVLT
jgi:hypothetical protein